MSDNLARREAEELARRGTELLAEGIARPEAGEEERFAEAALRPRRLEEFIGQERVR